MAACAVALLAFVGVVGLGAVGTSVAGFSASDTSLDASTAESDALPVSDIPASDGGGSAEVDAAASNDSDGADDTAAEGSGESYAAGNVLLVVDAALSVNDVQDRLAVEGVSVESVEVVSTELENDETLMLVRYEGEEDAAGLSGHLAELDFVSVAQPNYLYTLAEGDGAADGAKDADTSDGQAESDDPESGGNEAASADGVQEADVQVSTASVSTNDPYASKQWEHDSIGISEAWDIAQCDNEVTVAVIDSGVDYDHPDLAANLLLDYAKNCHTDTAGVEAVDDANGHGSHVAGIIAGVADNSIGIAGTSYNANILPIKATYFSDRNGNEVSTGADYGYMSTSDVVKALDYVVSLKEAATTEALANIRVVNLSLGGTENDSSLEAAVQRTDAAGIVVVAAAGNHDSRINQGGDYTSYPAAYDNVIAVGNLQQSGSSVALYSSSNKGSFVDITAPGTNIYSTIPSSTYGTKTGTSMASPVVAAVAALVCAADPDATPDEVEEILTDTALDLGDEGYDTSYGYGEVQADAAVAQAAGVDLGDDSSGEDGEGDSGDTGDTGDSDSGTGPTASSVIMYRMYNPNSGEHFYTASAVEKDSLVAAGWNYEGIGWYAPESSGTPVYRLYNPNPGPNGSGEHHYTTSSVERHMLVLEGWNYEGIGWYSDDAQGVPLYRQYNPNAYNCNHNYTTSEDENDWLVSLGWKAEGIAWYGVK